MSLQGYVRECLRALTGDASPDDVADELLELMDAHGGHSGGHRIRRDDAYEGRVR